MLRVAIIGAGTIVGQHIEAIAQIDRLIIAAVAEVREERAEEVAKRYGVKPYTDYKVMLDKEKIDIVIVALPHFLHKEVSIYCANMKCHILMEKPMALNIEECEEMIEMILSAQHNQIQLMVGLTQHYFKENRKAKELIRQGDIGELVMINDIRHQNYFVGTRPEWFFHKSQAGGGIITNLGAHSVDKIQWLLDSRIRKVSAHLSHYGNRGDVEGSGSLFLVTESGVPATIVQSGYEGVPRHETHLIFTRGMIRLETGRGLWISEKGIYKEVPIQEAPGPYVLQLLDLLDAIDEVRPLECSGEYAKSVTSVIAGVYCSHELGTEVVI
jgi:predicted dehydrogenase